MTTRTSVRFAKQRSATLSFTAYPGNVSFAPGTRLPIVLTRRTESVLSRLAPCVVASLNAPARLLAADVPAA
jgi:hypothetical protein